LSIRKPSDADDEEDDVSSPNTSQRGQPSTAGAGTLAADKDAAIWIPDNEAFYCMVCRSEFTLIKRKHHCRNCGKVICGSCSSKKLLLKHIDPQNLVRVCQVCYHAHFN